MEKFRMLVLSVWVQFWEHPPIASTQWVHSSLAFLHLHFFTQPSLHCRRETSSRQILDASGSVVQRGSYMPLVLIQPQSVGDGNVGTWPRHVCPGILLVRRAAPGLHLSMVSAGRCIYFANSLRHALLRCLFCRETVWWTSQWCAWHLHQYDPVQWREDWVSGQLGRAVHTAHAVFYPYPAKQETVSQPVKPPNIGSACSFSGPRARAISWPAEMRKDFPILMTPIFQFPPSGTGVHARATARTTTSVSTVRMRIFLWPLWAAWAACNVLSLSASSWLQGWSIQKRWLTQDIISFSDNQFLVCKLEWVVENAIGEAEQVWLVLVDSEEAVSVPLLTTRLLTPFPRLALVFVNESVM